MEHIVALLDENNIAKFSEYASNGLDFFLHYGNIGICACEDIMPIQNFKLGTYPYTKQTTPISKENQKIIEVTIPFMVVGSLLANDKDLLESLGLSIVKDNLMTGQIQQETIIDTLMKLETKEFIRDLIVISNFPSQQATASVKVSFINCKSNWIFLIFIFTYVFLMDRKVQSVF